MSCLKLCSKIIGPYLLLALALVPWAYSLWRTPPHSDLLWLYEAFARWMWGLDMADHIFEPNPPLSLFTYAPVYFASALTGLPVGFGLLAYVLLLVGLSAWAIHIIMIRLLGNDSVLYAVPVVICFILSQTMATLALYGERDQIVALGLIPFVLLQYAGMKGHKFARGFERTIWMLGTFCILLKPHYGLLPAALIASRIWMARDIRAAFKNDFFFLVGGVGLYALLLLFVFRDYIVTIFPDVVRFYLPDREAHLGKACLAFALPLLAVLVFIHKKMPAGIVATLAQLLLGGALLGLVPYYVQGKGFYYHLLPSLSFLFMALGLVASFYLKHEVKKEHTISYLVLGAGLVLGFLFFPLNFKLPDSKAYQTFPLTAEIEKSCTGQPSCSFMMFNDNMGIVHETAYVTGYIHASRFPAYWFLPRLLDLKTSNPAAFEKSKASYAERVADDLSYYKPRLLVIGRFRIEGDDFFDFPSFWEGNTRFDEEWVHYEHQGALTLSYETYYPDTLAASEIPVTYDLYRRRDE